MFPGTRSASPAFAFATLAPPPSAPSQRGWRRFLPDSDGMSAWQVAFLVLSGTLSASIGYKLASIQFLEYIYFFQISLIALAFARRGYRGAAFKPFLPLAAMYVVLAVVALAFAVASLRYDFYMPSDLQTLRYPVLISVSRLLELFANVSILLFLADQFRRKPMRARFFLKIYFSTGVASAVYSIVSFPLSRLGFDNLGFYSITDRARGFYNEGGPYGNYLVTVFVVAWLLYRMRWETPRRLLLGTALLLVGAVLSASKAAAVAVLLLFVLNVFLASSFYTRLSLTGATVIALLIFSQSADIELGLRIYRQTSVAYESLSLKHRGDTNFVNGRIAGIFIVPRMIAAHPITGIGWGNYTVLRNAPEYRGASAWSAPAFTDDPGLGLYGLAAEIGIPLLLLLLVCLFYPYALLRARRVPLSLANLALAQPIAHLCGAQLNSTYPWVLTAAALGIAFALPRAGDLLLSQVPVSSDLPPHLAESDKR